jgi:hypothetical protein
MTVARQPVHRSLGPTLVRADYVRAATLTVGHLARSTMIHIFWTTSFPSDHSDILTATAELSTFIRDGNYKGLYPDFCRYSMQCDVYKVRARNRDMTSPSSQLNGNSPVV